MLFYLTSPLKAQDRMDIYCFIEMQGIKNPDIVYKQAVLETGHFTSYSFTHRKNLFGATNGKGQYLTFTSWKESIRWYKRWQYAHYCDGDYYSFLKCIYRDSDSCKRYAEDTLYISKLKNIKL